MSNKYFITTKKIIKMNYEKIDQDVFNNTVNNNSNLVELTKDDILHLYNILLTKNLIPKNPSVKELLIDNIDNNTFSIKKETGSGSITFEKKKYSFISRYIFKNIVIFKLKNNIFYVKNKQQFFNYFSCNNFTGIENLLTNF